MDVKKAVSAIIFDKNGSNYFLILKREQPWKGWGFSEGTVMEGEDMLQAVKRVIKHTCGIAGYNVLGMLKQKREFEQNGVKYEVDVFLVETNMNTPVIINHDIYSTYLWGTPQSVSDKLTMQNEKVVFQDCMAYLSSQQKR